jgi:hypothetical protein
LENRASTFSIGRMRSWLLLRLAFAFVLGWVFVAMVPSCGARNDIEGFGGAGGGSGLCGLLGDGCGDGQSCCGELLCKGGLCKPAQICEPNGKPAPSPATAASSTA